MDGHVKLDCQRSGQHLVLSAVDALFRHGYFQPDKIVDAVKSGDHAAVVRHFQDLGDAVGAAVSVHETADNERRIDQAAGSAEVRSAAAPALCPTPCTDVDFAALSGKRLKNGLASSAGVQLAVCRHLSAMCAVDMPGHEEFGQQAVRCFWRVRLLCDRFV
jgi:hypothetical protein